MRGIVLSTLLASLVAAAPQPKPYEVVPVGTTTVVETLYSTSTAAPTPIALIPCPNPDIDQDDLDNLKATKDATLRYAESMDDVDQEVATIHSEDIDNPLVQLEHTSFIKHLTCDDNSATVVFSDKKAYQTAADDWKTHEKFIIVSYDPECGPNHDATKRDFMLASKVTPDDKTMTIKADISFVEFDDAFGNDAIITCDVGRYHATAPVKRWPWDDWGIDKSGQTSFNWNAYPTNEMTNNYNWGSGYQVFSDSSTTVACVGCGTDGDVTLTGTIQFTIGDGLKKAEVKMEGHMKATLALGIQASLSKTFPIADVNLATIPLTPFTIGGVITLGPQIGIDASADLTLAGSGGMVVGATLDWPAFKATADYATSSANAEGLQPNITPKTQFDGTLSATVTFDLPVSVGIGLTIKAPVAGTVFDKQISLIDSPGFSLTTGISTEDQCEGVTVDADLHNNVDVNVFDITQVNLLAWTTTLFQTCIATAQSTETSTTVEVTPTSTPQVPISTGVTGTGVTGTGVTGTGVTGTAPSDGIPTLPPQTSAPFSNGTSTITSAPAGYPTGTGSTIGTLSTIVSGQYPAYY